MAGEPDYAVERMNDYELWQAHHRATMIAVETLGSWTHEERQWLDRLWREIDVRRQAE